MRSDLFRRPLEEVRITDFFGGVAHVEVGAATGGGAGVDREDHGEDRAPDWEESRVGAESSVGAERTENTTWGGPALTDAQTRGWRGTRAWCGVLLLGVLVGWVGWRSTT